MGLVAGGIILILLSIVFSFGIVAAITGWGILPVVEAFGGPELPFWPVFLLVWFLLCAISYKPAVINAKKKENA